MNICWRQTGDQNPNIITRPAQTSVGDKQATKTLL